MSLTLPELACVIAIGVAAIQLPQRDVAQLRSPVVQRNAAVVQRDPGMPARDTKPSATSTKAADATNESRPQ